MLQKSPTKKRGVPLKSIKKKVPKTAKRVVKKPEKNLYKFVDEIDYSKKDATKLLEAFEEKVKKAKELIPNGSPELEKYYNQQLIDLHSFYKDFSHAKKNENMKTLPKNGTLFELKTHGGIKGHILKNIYNGSSSKVFIVSLYIGEKDFIKILKVSLRKFDDLDQEIKILDQLKNPYMFERGKVKLGKYIYDCAILDYMGTSLNHLKNIPKEDIYKKIFTKLQKMHKYKILHQDIKPVNILYNEFTNDVNFIDFGFSVSFDKEKVVEQEGYTIDFVSPYQMLEMILSDRVDYYYAPKKKFVYGYRILDDYISLFYTIADLEGKNFYRMCEKKMKEIDKEFVQKYKKRDEYSFRQFKPKNIFEEMYKLFFDLNVEKKDSTYLFTNRYIIRSKDLTEREKKNWIDGTSVDSVMKLCIRSCSIYYKLNHVDFNEVTCLQKYVKKFDENVLQKIKLNLSSSKRFVPGYCGF